MSQEYYSIEKKTNLGELRIGLQVFETIIVDTISKMEGVELEGSNALSMHGNKGPVTVRVNKNNQLSVDINVIIDYGVNVSILTNKMQTKISTAIMEMTGLKYVKINIGIKGINF